MSRGTILTAVLFEAALVLVGGASVARDCTRAPYDHNGSLMEIIFCGGEGLTIRYLEPRPEIEETGVRSGTVLFKGSQNGSGEVTGEMTLHDAACGPEPYAVAGEAIGDGLVLQGAAPIRGPDCMVERYQEKELVFTWKGAEAQEPFKEVPASDWYAIAAATRDRAEAQDEANRLGAGWFVMNTDRCPNFSEGFWIATAGPFEKQKAARYAAGIVGGYIKSCR